MEFGTVDGDPTEAGQVVTAPKTEAILVENLTDAPAPKPGQQRLDLQRTMRWRRTIIVEGPAEWVQRTRANSLTEGVHQLGVKNGVACTIEVATEDIEHKRHMSMPTTNEIMTSLRQDNPEAYEAVHGPGTAKSHANYEERARLSSSAPATATVASEERPLPGQYL